MRNEKKGSLRSAITTLFIGIVPLAIYLDSDRCLKITSAGFWLIFAGGMCFGVSISMFRNWIKKEKVEQ